MAIHPKYATAILSGVKTAEFRKRRIAHDIRTVIIYATAPVSRVVGLFEVADVVEDTPDKLWLRLHAGAGIDHCDYSAYFTNHEKAFALLVDSSTPLSQPVSIGELDPDASVPQSWNYLPATVLERLPLVG